MSSSRVQAGVPSGGQFAASRHAESQVGLDPHVIYSARTFLAAIPDRAPDGTEVEMEGTIYNPVLSVTAGVLDDRARDAFRQGQCHALALALHERTGWPVVARIAEGCAFDEDCPEDNDSDDICDCQYEHLAVRRPDGMIVDVNGPFSEEEFLEAGSDPEWTQVVEVPEDRMTRILHSDPSWRQPDIAVARSFVDPVLAIED